MTPDIRKIKWGVLGYARIARETMIPAILRSTNAELYAVASRDKSKIEECTSRFSFSRAYDNYDAMLDDPDIEAVYIPLPNALHKEWVMKAAEKKKHILCEKPISLTASECREMIDVCSRNNVSLMEGFMYRFSERTRKVQEIIESGVLGDIKVVNSSHRFLLTNMSSIKLKPELGGGALFDVGCYPVNFVGMITQSEPESVSVEYHSENGVDVLLSAVLKYTSGMLATIHCGFYAQKRIFSEIIGTRAILEVPDTFLEDEGFLTLITESGTEKIPVSKSDRFRSEIEDFSQAIIDHRPPALSLAETARNMRVLDKIVSAMKKNT